MTARVALLVAAWAILAIPAAAQTTPDLFGEGVESFRSGDYARSQRLLREYVDANADKKGADAAHLGEAYHYLGLMTPDARLAEGYFLAVAQRYPTAPTADESVARLGQLYFALGRYADARREWNALATNYPKSRYVPAANLRIGQTYFAEGDLQNAYDAFSSGFSKMKTFQRSGGRGADLTEIEGEYVFWLGRTLLARKANGDARKYFNLVLLDYPNHPLEPVALYYLSLADRGDGKTKEADDAWRRFSESVRNTSLEPVARNPNLVAIAGARESGALTRPPEADARIAERRAGEAQAESGGEPETESSGEPPAAVPTPPGGALTGTPSGRATTPAEPPAADAEAEPATAPALRAPEPGRAGGVVEEQPASEAPADETFPAEEERPRAAEVAEPAPAPREAATPAPAPTEEPAPEPQAEEVHQVTSEDQARAAQVEQQGQELLGRRTEVAQPAGKEAARAEPAPPATANEPTPAPARTAVPTEPAARAAVTPPPPGKAATDRTLEPIEPGLVYLQVGAFTGATTAAQVSTELKKKKFNPSITTTLKDGKAVYRVRFGPYDVPRERETLETQRTALLKAGYVPVVMRREAEAESGR
ncbi:MAG TPA: tetratricopeptide repeat protein [Gemmatimonadota bacterium]